jgi:transposase
MSKRERRKYDPEFKIMAVELHLNGKSFNEVSNDLDVHPDLIRRWFREYKTSGTKSFPGNGKQNLSEEQKEIIALKKALNDALIERDILKKAVSIFSKGDSKFTGS